MHFHHYAQKLRGVAFDLHVLGTPPAFILSQDQTLIISFYETFMRVCFSPFLQEKRLAVKL